MMKGWRANEGGYHLGDNLLLGNGSSVVIVGAEDGFLRIEWGERSSQRLVEMGQSSRHGKTKEEPLI